MATYIIVSVLFASNHPTNRRINDQPSNETSGHPVFAGHLIQDES